MAVDVGVPDHDLLARARDGDDEAFAVLYHRHHRAATGAAHRYSSRSQLAEDAVQEAFLRILRGTRAGKGPDREFRAYLATTVRHVIAGWVRSERTVATDDLEAIAGEDTRPETSPEGRLHWHLLTRAYGSLPTRWQEALWHGEVEGVPISELAERWNMSPNAASALSHRAREGLRTAWLDAHVNADLVPDECRPFVADLSRYAQGTLTERRDRQVRAHVDDCEYCPVVLLEIGTAAAELRAVLVPVALWAGGLTAGGVGALGLVSSATSWVTGLGRKGLVVGAAATAAAVTVAVVVPWQPQEAGVVAAPPSQTSSPPGSADSADDGPTTDLATQPDATPAPTDVPDTDDPVLLPVTPEPDGDGATSVPQTPGGPAAPDPVDSDPTDPVAPTDPDPTDPVAPVDPDPAALLALDLDVDLASVRDVAILSGTGARVGATVTVRIVGGRELGTTSVGTDGSWSLQVPLRALTGSRTVEAVQTLDGATSPSSSPRSLPAFVLAPPEVDERPLSSITGLGLSGRGDPGARVSIRVVATGTEILSTTVGADGRWSIVGTLTPALSAVLVDARQVSTDGYTSAASPALRLPQLLDLDPGSGTDPGAEPGLDPEPDPGLDPEPDPGVEPEPELAVPDAPRLLLSTATGQTAVLTVTATPGARLDLRVVGGDTLVSTTVGSTGLVIVVLADARIAGRGLTLEAVQVVDGVPSPASAPVVVVALPVL